MRRLFPVGLLQRYQLYEKRYFFMLPSILFDGVSVIYQLAKHFTSTSDVSAGHCINKSCSILSGWLAPATWIYT